MKIQKFLLFFNQKSQKVYIDFSLNFIQILIKNLQFFLGLLDSWLSIGPNIMTCYASLVGKHISLITREGLDIGLFLHSPQYFIKLFLSVGSTTMGTFIEL